MSHARRAADGTTGTVRDAMVTRPKVGHPEITVAQAREAFANTHVHMVLLADRHGLLRGTLVRTDLDPAGSGSDAVPALAFSKLRGRTVSPDAFADRVRGELIDEGLRRLAVVDDDGMLLGLLCLKRRLHGFCSDRDVAARAADPKNSPGGQRP